MTIADYIKTFFSKGGNNPVKFLLLYSVIIIPTALILGNLLAEEKVPAVQNASIIDSSTLKEPVKKKNEKEEKTDSASYVDPIELKISELMRVYDARNFDDLDYEFTYDLQADIVGKKILFYAYISDIYKEGRDLYIKALKSSSNKNYYLKVKCDTASAKILRSNGLFSYFLVKVSGAQKIFLNSVSTKSRANNPSANSQSQSVPEKETVLITGVCLATIKQK